MGANGKGIGAEIGLHGPYHKQAQDDNGGARSGADTPALDLPRTDTGGGSAQDSVPGSLSSSGTPRRAGAEAGGFSTADAPATSTSTPPKLPQTNPGSATDSALDAGAEISSAGSIAAPDPMAPAAASPPQRPITRLQQGISKPKVYTDGTVCWCNLAASFEEEPTTVADALRDNKWVEAMNAEYQALMRNKTW